MIEDADLLQAWRDGDATAGRTLVDRHFGAVYRFFSNKVTTEIDDLVQQTFLACVEGRDRIRGDVRSYLFGVARNLLYRRFRDRERDLAEATASDLASDGPTPAEAVAERQEQRLLLRALRKIPIDLQILLELRYWEALTDRELAAAFDVPMGTIKSRLRKGRALVEAVMAEIERDQALLTSTVDGFDNWVALLRERVDADARERSNALAG